MVGTIEHIHVADAEGGTPRPVQEAEALAGLGLAGDRLVNAAGDGGTVPAHKQLTLIEAEAIEAAARDHDLSIPLGADRRNIMVRGVALNHLVGQTFRVGGAVVRGKELCEPCAYLERTTGIKGIVKSLIHRGGLRCEVVSGGTVRVGESIGERVDG
ncbi:MAG: MOSC domain-containing protein [Phycisphaerales bacterium]